MDAVMGAKPRGEPVGLLFCPKGKALAQRCLRKKEIAQRRNDAAVTLEKDITQRRYEPPRRSGVFGKELSRKGAKERKGNFGERDITQRKE